MPKTKNVLLRLDPSVAETLQAIANVENRSVSEIAREAIQDLIDRRRTDSRFQRQLEQTLGEQMKVLEQLRGES